MSTTFRADRAGEAIRMAVARVLREEVSDPRLESVTITACEVARDLGFARIFYTVYGDDDARAAAEAGFAVSVGSVGSLDRASISAAVERHLDQRVAGIVVIAPVASANEALDHLHSSVPLVTVDRVSVGVDCKASSIDQYSHFLSC